MMQRPYAEIVSDTSHTGLTHYLDELCVSLLTNTHDVYDDDDEHAYYLITAQCIQILLNTHASEQFVTHMQRAVDDTKQHLDTLCAQGFHDFQRRL